MWHFDDAASTPALADQTWGEVLSTAQAAQIQGGARRTPVTDLSQSLGIGLVAVSTTSKKKNVDRTLNPTLLLDIFSALGDLTGSRRGNRAGRNQTIGSNGLAPGGF